MVNSKCSATSFVGAEEVWGVGGGGGVGFATHGEMLYFGVQDKIH